MKPCPFCNKENSDNSDTCSCGYFFNNKLYEEKQNQKATARVAEESRHKTNTKVKTLEIMISVPIIAGIGAFIGLLVSLIIVLFMKTDPVITTWVCSGLGAVAGIIKISVYEVQTINRQVKEDAVVTRTKNQTFFIIVAFITAPLAVIVYILKFSPEPTIALCVSITAVFHSINITLKKIYEISERHLSAKNR